MWRMILADGLMAVMDGLHLDFRPKMTATDKHVCRGEGNGTGLNRFRSPGNDFIGVTFHIAHLKLGYLHES